MALIQGHGGSLWIGCKLERGLNSRLKRASHSKGRQAGARKEKSTGSEITQSSTMPVSHKSSLVKHKLLFVHEIISALVSTCLKAQ